MTTTRDIVQKLWRLCDVLRDDGITYHQYVTDLTWLLFLKMEQETRDIGRDGRRPYSLPEGYRWEDLCAKTGIEQQTFYRELLLHLGTRSGAGGPEAIVVAIYADAATSIRKPATLSKLVEDIDGLDWYDAKQEGLGDLYEGLLEKNAGEKKSGAGQYLMSVGKQTTNLTSINKTQLSRFPVPIPPRAGQVALLLQIRGLLGRMTAVSEHYGKRRVLLDSQVQALLAAAFRDLVTQNPDDEPASVVLERICAQRAAAKIKKPQKKSGRTGRKAKSGTL